MAIAHRKLGTGPPLLLINGFGGSREDWDPTLLDILASGSTVHCPDNRGIGESDVGDEPISIELMAKDMLGLLDELGLDSVAVAGWSMGGFIAQALAAIAPDRVTRLVLMGTSPGGELSFRGDPASWQKLTDHSGTPHERARRLLELLYPEPLVDGIYEQFGDVVAAAQEKLDLDVLRQQAKAITDWYRSDAETRLIAITARALAIAGTEDIVVNPANAELMASRLPDGWLARFRGAGHAVMAQEAERVGNLINVFLAR